MLDIYAPYVFISVQIYVKALKIKFQKKKYTHFATCYLFQKKFSSDSYNIRGAFITLQLMFSQTIAAWYWQAFNVRQYNLIVYYSFRSVAPDQRN